MPDHAKATFTPAQSTHGPAPSGRKPVMTVTNHALGALQKFWDLFIVSRWSNNTLRVLLNEEDVVERARLTNEWAHSTLSTQNTLVVVAALIAGVVTSAFSWPDLVTTSWVTRALWYGALVLSITSISSAALNIGALLRMRCAPRPNQAYRRVLGKIRGGHYEPRAFQAFVWGMPGLFLKISLLFFLGGLAVHLWTLAVQAQLRWTSDELKVATFVTITAVCALVIYLVGVIHLFYPTLKQFNHDEQIVEVD